MDGRMREAPRPRRRRPRRPVSAAAPVIDLDALYLPLERADVALRLLELRAPWATPAHREAVRWAIVRGARGHIDTAGAVVSLWCGHRSAAARTLAEAGFVRTPDVRRGLHYDLARAPVTADDLVRLDETLAWARSVLDDARAAQARERVEIRVPTGDVAGEGTPAR